MKTQVLIIGGGATGTGLARDLALRGLECLLVEKRDINAGASGGNHGLLHSGARYVGSDPGAARECREEADLLRHLAGHCLEDTGGMFVAVEGDDEKYIADFPGLCEKCGIPAQPVGLQEARALEPALSERLIAAFLVRDGSIDPFRLSLDNMAQARQHGTGFLRQARVKGFITRGRRIEAVRIENILSGQEVLVEAEMVVNAAGAWAGQVAGLAGISVSVLYSKGTLLVTHNRLTKRVINRLRPASNADIVVPGGTVSVLGTTSQRIADPDQAFPTVEEIDLLVDDARWMIPALETARYIRAYCGVRPLIGSGEGGDDRSVSRGFAFLDHQRQGLENFITIAGGKLTTYRLMAEKTADLVCRRLGLSRPGRTAAEPLPASRPDQWTEPALAPKTWLKGHEPGDILLCECEMVPKSAVEAIVSSLQEQGSRVDFQAIGLRSRIGKGPCQGTFCGPRLLSYLFDQGILPAAQGVDGLKDFLRSRWKGLYPILWGRQLKQAELLEAMHCGLFGLEEE